MSILDKVRGWFDPPAGDLPPLHQADGAEGRVLDALRDVIDPELGVDIVSLGLVREILLTGDVAHVRMVLTTPGCPVAGMLVEQIEYELRDLGHEPSIELLPEPAWRPEDMSPEARAALGH